jgi:type II secretion system protein I
MHRPAHNSARGFTLLEVLLATMIIGSVFVAVVGLLSQSLRNIERLKSQERILWHAQQKMNEALVRETLSSEIESGAWSDGYRWELRIAPAEGQPQQRGASYGLFDLHLTISWGEDAAPKTYAVETLQWAQVPKNAAH